MGQDQPESSDFLTQWFADRANSDAETQANILKCLQQEGRTLEDSPHLAEFLKRKAHERAVIAAANGFRPLANGS